MTPDGQVQTMPGGEHHMEFISKWMKKNVKQRQKYTFPQFFELGGATWRLWGGGKSDKSVILYHNSQHTNLKNVVRKMMNTLPDNWIAADTIVSVFDYATEDVKNHDLETLW